MSGIWGIVGEHTADWSGALCIGLASDLLEDFYPDKGTAQVQASRAKKICNGETALGLCPRLDQCLEYALTNHERFGIWGGMSERERDRLKKDRAAAAEARRARRVAASRAAWETRRANAGRRSATA